MCADKSDTSLRHAQEILTDDENGFNVLAYSKMPLIEF